jgi:hypothetical protein
MDMHQNAWQTPYCPGLVVKRVLGRIEAIRRAAFGISVRTAWKWHGPIPSLGRGRTA